MIEVGFYVLSAFMLFTPWFVLFRKQPGTPARTYALIAVLWVTYTIGLSASGVLHSFAAPPRVPLLLVIPVLLFVLWITGRSRIKERLLAIANHTLVFVQAFRILVELLIYGAFLNGVYPVTATFEGINYDILVGVSALIMGLLVMRKIVGLTGILIWNGLSLIILTLTVYSFISTYYFTDFVARTGSNKFVEVPYVFLPGILLPFAVFYHVLSIRQQLMKRRN